MAASSWNRPGMLCGVRLSEAWVNTLTERSIKLAVPKFGVLFGYRNQYTVVQTGITTGFDKSNQGGQPQGLGILRRQFRKDVGQKEGLVAEITIAFEPIHGIGTIDGFENSAHTLWIGFGLWHDERDTGRFDLLFGPHKALRHSGWLDQERLGDLLCFHPQNGL